MQGAGQVFLQGIRPSADSEMKQSLAVGYDNDRGIPARIHAESRKHLQVPEVCGNWRAFGRWQGDTRVG